MTITGRGSIEPSQRDSPTEHTFQLTRLIELQLERAVG